MRSKTQKRAYNENVSDVEHCDGSSRVATRPGNQENPGISENKKVVQEMPGKKKIRIKCPGKAKLC